MFERLKNSHIPYLIINLFILLIFFILNKKYEKEYNAGKDDIRTLNLSILSGNDNIVKEILLKKLSFKENQDTYKLFKNMYIRKNLIAKDYNELKSVFHKFIPESFLREIGNMGTDKITLGLSVKKYLNVMFLDIIGFTSITEKLPPDRALLLLNVYFDGMIEIIKNNGGYIDKFLGDGIMAIFDGSNSDGTIKAAIEIQNFINRFQVSEIGRKLSVGIGINSGDVILGTIGSNERMEITIIGDIVNTASRIEGLTRNFVNNIIITESTYDAIKNLNDFSIKNLGLNQLRGKKTKIKLFGVDSVMNLEL